MDQASSAPRAAPPTLSTSCASRRRRTRPSALYAQRLADNASILATHALESCSEPDHLSLFNAALFQALGNDSSPYQCASFDSDGLGLTPFPAGNES